MIHQKKTRLELAEELSKCIFEYLQHSEVYVVSVYTRELFSCLTFRQDSSAGQTHRQWRLGKGGLDKEQIWMDSISYYKVDDCFVPRLFVQGR